LQRSSSLLTAVVISSSNIEPSTPGQAHGCGRVGDDALAAAGEAKRLAGRRLHRDAVDADAGDARDRCAHGVAVRADLRRLRDDVEVEMRDHAAALTHALDREGEELVGGGAL